ncbi:HipA domain-containing protein [Sutterella sp.]|uniref:HipA domain-containing protein n=1 Tax=Sutterella sp. TaxID=1981025 RepID=UPI0026E000F2|nr:HipA domain-containing protein [Sutterella sp.]MDO5532542.1 HipA domain-containing protein [Sutterella sp.]
MGSHLAEGFEDAGNEERAAVLLPSASAHAGGLSFFLDGTPAGSPAKVPGASQSVEPMLYARHSLGRGRQKQKNLITLAQATTLPGKHSAFVVLSESSEAVLTLGHEADMINVPLWRGLLMDLARDCGLRVAHTKTAQISGEQMLFTERVDRDESGEVLTLSARTLSPSYTATWLGMADILNADGTAPTEDLPELWRRMVFILLTGSETSGAKWLFYRTDLGWRIAKTHGFSPQTGAPRPMTVDGRRTLTSIEDAIALCRYFGLTLRDAKTTALSMRRSIADWQDRALALGADPGEIEILRPGFEAM